VDFSESSPADQGNVCDVIATRCILIVAHFPYLAILPKKRRNQATLSETNRSFGPVVGYVRDVAGINYIELLNNTYKRLKETSHLLLMRQQTIGTFKRS
jgi:hypothetical protein